jgi:4'-phosphopantetheinyl transferase EntD
MPTTYVVSHETLVTVPPGLVVLWAQLDEHAGALLGNEHELVIGGSLLRHRQVATGRRLAREAIGRVGGDVDSPIPADFNNVPIWPEGITGSISHTASLCAVAVARSGTVAYLGVDVETDEANFSEQEWRLVCSDEELSAAAHCQNLSAHRLVNLIFSAKEAVYKSLYPVLRGRQIDFADLRCQLQSNFYSFNVSVLIEDQTLPRSLSVNWTSLPDHILTLAWRI